MAKCCALLLAITMSVMTASAATVQIRVLPDRVAADRIELRGVGAGAFDPAMWEKATLHWVSDVRSPMLMPREGKFRNIYAASAVQTRSGWRIFFGGWDGVATPNDRIYRVDTRDFIEFENRETVIEHGEFEHVCNVSALRNGDGKFEILCTTLAARGKPNKPVYFTAGDDPTAPPHAATTRDLITMSGYPGFDAADINGMNVLLREGDERRMYFCNLRDGGRVFRASSREGRAYRFEKAVLDANPLVNDVKEFRIGSDDWYLMGLHLNTGQLWYSLSRDGLKFPPVRKLFEHEGDGDAFMVSLGFVIAGEQEVAGRRVLGVVYGAGAKRSLDQNRIFARWLQKRVVIAGMEVKRALGPEWAVIESGKPIEGKFEMYGEDGTTPLGSVENVKLENGRAYEISATSVVP